MLTNMRGALPLARAHRCNWNLGSGDKAAVGILPYFPEGDSPRPSSGARQLAKLAICPSGLGPPKRRGGRTQSQRPARVYHLRPGIYLWGGRGSNPRPTDYRPADLGMVGPRPSFLVRQQDLVVDDSDDNRTFPDNSRSLAMNKR
jgi:hypothetical protein